MDAARIPALLWAAGVAALAVLTGGMAWPLALGWAAAGVVLAQLYRRLGERARITSSAVLVPALVLLTWEGGLFFLPAALAVSWTSSRRTRARTYGPEGRPRPSG